MYNVYTNVLVELKYKMKCIKYVLDNNSDSTNFKIIQTNCPHKWNIVDKNMYYGTIKSCCNQFNIPYENNHHTLLNFYASNEVQNTMSFNYLAQCYNNYCKSQMNLNF